MATRVPQTPLIYLNPGSSGSLVKTESATDRNLLAWVCLAVMVSLHNYSITTQGKPHQVFRLPWLSCPRPYNYTLLTPQILETRKTQRPSCLTRICKRPLGCCHGCNRRHFDVPHASRSGKPLVRSWGLRWTSLHYILVDILTKQLL